MGESFKPIKVDGGNGGGAPTIRVKMAASQTIAEGDPVSISSGVVSISAAGDSAIFGVAAEAATSEASGDYYMTIYPARRDIIWAATASGTITIANMYTTAANSYDLAGSTGAFTVNLSASSDDIFQIVDIPNGIEHGTFGTSVYVKVTSSGTTYEV